MYVFQKNKSIYMLIETSLIAKVIIILVHPQLLIMLGIPIYIVLEARKA